MLLRLFVYALGFGAGAWLAVLVTRALAWVLTTAHALMQPGPRQSAALIWRLLTRGKMGPYAIRAWPWWNWPRAAYIAAREARCDWYR